MVLIFCGRWFVCVIFRKIRGETMLFQSSTFVFYLLTFIILMFTIVNGQEVSVFSLTGSCRYSDN